MKNRDRGSVLDNTPADPNMVYDCATDQFRAKGHPVRTVGQIAMERTEPAPVAEPEIGAHLFTPTADQVASACTSNGNDPDKARHAYVESGRTTFRRLRKLLPGAASVIATDFQRAEEFRLRALAALGKTTEQLNDLRQKLGERANLRQSIVATRAEFESAKATLDSPESLKLDGPTLALLGTKLRHLPGEIAGMEAGLKPLTDEIVKAAGALKVELPSIVQSLFAEANERQGSGFADQNFKRLFEAGQIL